MNVDNDSRGVLPERASESSPEAEWREIQLGI